MKKTHGKGELAIGAVCILLGFLLFDEQVTPRQILGAVIIIVGILLFVRADHEGEDRT